MKRIYDCNILPWQWNGPGCFGSNITFLVPITITVLTNPKEIPQQAFIRAGQDPEVLASHTPTHTHPKCVALQSVPKARYGSVPRGRHLCSPSWLNAVVPNPCLVRLLKTLMLSTRCPQKKKKKRFEKGTKLA